MMAFLDDLLKIFALGELYEKSYPNGGNIVVITIDGPVASGKSTVARMLAKKLGFYYLNTGLLYRTVAYLFLNGVVERITFVTKESVATLKLEDLAWVGQLTYKYYDDEAHVFYDQQDLTPFLYDSKLDQLASIVSVSQIVRETLLGLQRSISKEHDIVVDGRDCGTIVFPSADAKFFLTANVTVRASRFLADPRRAVEKMTLKDAKASIEERDRRDKERKIAPLKVPKSAIVVDSSDISIEQTIDVFLQCLNSYFTKNHIQKILN